MKKLFLLFSMLSITTFLMAQEVIGKVVDSNGKPLPYVNIVLLNTQDSTFIRVRLVDKMGISLYIMANLMEF